KSPRDRADSGFGMDLNAVLMRVFELGASDVHFKLGKPPMVRRDGAIEELPSAAPLTGTQLDDIVEILTTHVPDRRTQFEETGELDLSYQAESLPRFRVNAFKQRGATSLAFRIIPRNVPSFGDLHLPPGVARLAEEHRGLVLVTGATGSGKSTTLAAIVNHIN